MAVALLAACGRQAGAPAPATKEAAQITFWQYQDQATTELFQKYVDAFNAEGRGAVVHHERVESAKKAPAAAANSMADLDLSNPNHPVSFAGRDGGMVALDDYIRAKGQAGVPVGEYLPAPWGLYTWKKKQYGVPLQAAIKNFIYNKDYFAEAGVTHLPTTWEAFVDTGKRLVQRQGDAWQRSFTDLPAGLNRPWHEFSYRNNAKRVNDDLTRSLANSPESVQTVQYLVDLIHVHGLQPKPEVLTKEQVDFAAGRSATFFGGFQNATQLLKSNPALKLGTLLFPYGPTPAKVTGIAGECLSMWDSCKAREQAFRFVRYMCYEKNLDWCKDYFIVPVTKAGLADPYYKSELMAPVVDTLSTHVYLRWMYDLGNTFPHANDLAAPLTTGLNDAYLLLKSPKQAMDEVADAQNAILAQYRAEIEQFLQEQA
jgi:ABC-type glycerol-3-phosphate transport system substrate-binding protein